MGGDDLVISPMDTGAAGGGVLHIRIRFPVEQPEGHIYPLDFLHMMLRAEGLGQ